jgi:hypothetical protein
MRFNQSPAGFGWRVTTTGDLLMRRDSATPAAKIVRHAEYSDLWCVVHPRVLPGTYERFEARSLAQAARGQRVA